MVNSVGTGAEERREIKTAVTGQYEAQKIARENAEGKKIVPMAAQNTAEDFILPTAKETMEGQGNGANANNTAMDAMTDAEYDAQMDVMDAEASMAGASMLYDDGRQYALVGKTEDGRKIYKTNYPKGTPKAVKQNDIVQMVQNIWSKQPIELTIVNDETGATETITANFDPELSERSDLAKIVYGLKRGTAGEKRMTLDLGPDLYQIAQDGVHTGGKTETGKDNPAHDGVKRWEYFVTNLVYEEEDGTQVDAHMNIDVKMKDDGGYFYSFTIEKGTAPQKIRSAVSETTSPTVPNNSISQNASFSQENFAQNTSGENVLPTAKELDRQRRAAKAETETERTGILLGVPQERINTVKRLSKIIGKEVVFYRNTDGKVKNDLGFYDHKTGRICINADATDPVSIIIGHEMIHDIQLADGYISFFKAVLQKMQADGINLSKARAELKARYAKNGVDLDTTAKIDQDLVAEYAQQHLFTDEASIASIVNADKESGHKILNFLDRILAKLGNKDARERAFVQKARALYAKALRESRGMETGGEYRGDTASAKSMAETKTASETMADARRETAADLRSTAEPMAGQNEARTMDTMTDEEYDARLDMEEAEASMAGQSMLYDDGRQFMMGNEKETTENVSLDKITEEEYNNRELSKDRDQTADNEICIIPKQQIVFAGMFSQMNQNPEFRALYENGKKGDTESAEQLAQKFVTEEYLAEFTKKYKNVTIIPVIGKEGTSTNVLPRYLAQYIAELTGNEFYGQIHKVSKNKIRSKSAGERLASHIEFAFANNEEGNMHGRRFVIFDDCISTGTTAHALRDFIEVNGGSVVGYASIAKGRDTTDNLAITKKQFQTLQRMMGEEYSYELSRLTARQAEALIGNKGLRNRISFGRGNSGANGNTEESGRVLGERRQTESDGPETGTDKEGRSEGLTQQEEFLAEKDGRQYAIAKEDAAVSQRETSAVEEPETMESIAKTYGEVKRTRRELEKVNRRMRLSDEEYDARLEMEEAEASMAGQSMLYDDGRQYMLVGKTADGTEVYETSDKTKKLSYKERMNEFKRLITEEYRGRTAKFVKKGKVFYAKFSPGDVKKSIYGDTVSSPEGWKAKINVGAEGDVFELVENATFDRGQAEKGKAGKLHSNVEHWSYFVKTVQIDNKVFDVLANVRERADGEYVYSITLQNNNEKTPAPPLTHYRTSTNDGGRVESGVLTSVNNSIPQNASFSQGNPAQNPSEGNVLPTAKDLMAKKAETNAHATAMDTMTDAEYDARLEMEEAEASMAGQSMLYDDGRQFMIGDKDGAEKYGETRVTEEKIYTDMPEDGRYEVLKNKRITPATTENVDASNIDFPYLESNIKSTVEKGLLKKFQELGLFKTYRSVAVGDIAFDFTGKGFRKSIHSQENFYGGSKADFAKVLLNLQNLLDSSVLIEMHTDKGKGTNKEKRGLDKVYVLFSALEDGEKIIPVQFEIEQYIGRDNRLYLAVALTKIETGVKGNMASDKQKATSLVPVSDISISEIFAKINPSDKNFLKYIPNQFLDAEQIAAKEEALEADRKKYLKNEESGRQYAIAKEDAAVSPRETSAVEEPETMESIAKTYGEVKRTRRELEKVNRRMRLSDEDKMHVGRLLRGEILPEHLPDGSDTEGILAVYEAKREYEGYAKRIRAYNRRRKDGLRAQAQEYLGNIQKWKDKVAFGGLRYSMETMERNFQDVMGKDADALIAEYLTPVHKATASSAKLKNEMRGRIKTLNLSRKVANKKNIKNPFCTRTDFLQLFSLHILSPLSA